MFAIRAARAFTGPAAHRQVRSRVSRNARPGHGRHARGSRCDRRGCRGAAVGRSSQGSETRSRREGELAAVIVEPVQALVRPAPEPRVLESLGRSATDRGAPIFDEIISFRIAPGGAQEVYGVRPDLTTPARHRRRLSARRLRGTGGRDGDLDARQSRAVSHGGRSTANPVGRAGLCDSARAHAGRVCPLAELGAG